MRNRLTTSGTFKALTTLSTDADPTSRPCNYCELSKLAGAEIFFPLHFKDHLIIHAAVVPFVSFFLFMVLPDFYVKSAASQVVVAPPSPKHSFFNFFVTGDSLCMHQPGPRISHCFGVWTYLLQVCSEFFRLWQLRSLFAPVFCLYHNFVHFSSQ
jgi:hypothetical protein